MKAKQETQVERQQAVSLGLKQQVCDLLGWDETQYCWYQYRQGLNYLHFMLKNDAFAVDTLEREPQFWGWWKIKYTQNDAAFIGLAHLDNLPLRQLQEQYRYLQHGHSIARFNPLERFLTKTIYKKFKLRQQCKL